MRNANGIVSRFGVDGNRGATAGVRGLCYDISIEGLIIFVQPFTNKTASHTRRPCTMEGWVFFLSAHWLVVETDEYRTTATDVLVRRTKSTNGPEPGNVYLAKSEICHGSHVRSTTRHSNEVGFVLVC